MRILLSFLIAFFFSLEAQSRSNTSFYSANAIIYSSVQPDNISNSSAGTFYDDADSDAIGLLFIRGDKKESLRLESEVYYGETPSEFSISSTVKANVKTLHLMQNVLVDLGVTETSSFVFGVGAGAHVTRVKTEAAGSDGDDDENFGLVYNVSAGIDINEKIELLARYSDYGKVEGGSNTTGGAPKFDYITHSLILKYKF